MTPALPTPYDITEIPYIPWSPGVLAWAVLVLVLAAILVMVTLALRKRPAKGRRVVELLLADIERVAAVEHDVDAQRLSHLARRVLEFLSGLELSSMSPGELEVLAKGVKSAVLADALRKLAAVESNVYAPPEAKRELELAANELVESLRAFVADTRERTA